MWPGHRVRGCSNKRVSPQHKFNWKICKTVPINGAHTHPVNILQLPDTPKAQASRRRARVTAYKAPQGGTTGIHVLALLSVFPQTFYSDHTTSPTSTPSTYVKVLQRPRAIVASYSQVT